MRSRYTAFVLGNADYLLATWDPAHRPPRLDLKNDRTDWLGLQVVSTERGGEDDSEGRVEFIAHFRLHGQEQSMREHSRFRKEDNRWLYIDGEMKSANADRAKAAPIRATAPSVGRNDPCPCGSGLKWKRCCGK
jgi:SEC-C motif-containing protein